MDSQLSTDSSKTEKNEATMITVGSSKNSPKIMIPSLVRDQGWVFGEEIGSGGFSHVYRVQNTKEFLNESERGIACKVIDLFVVNSDWARKHFRTEIRLCEQVNHPNLLRALKILKMRTKAYIFMPLAMYGTVTEYLIGHKRPLVESMVRRILRDLADGVGYLHVRNIVHRDLKLDNFLLIQKHKVVIADFGFAVIGDDATQLDANKETMAVWCSTICGTPEYVAPEIHGLIRGQQYDGKPADMYALGVSAFEMLHMVRPFRGGPFVVRSPELLRMQINCEFILIPRVKLSNGCSTLIHSLMNPKPQSRPTAATVLTNKWITT
ncbi:hypothetical protein BLOT_016654 [Blomia tropicalis]|nr:hypothetical protein BLOT_016654 [Blomia tropicalis]